MPREPRRKNFTLRLQSMWYGFLFARKTMLCTLGARSPGTRTVYGGFTGKSGDTPTLVNGGCWSFTSETRTVHSEKVRLSFTCFTTRAVRIEIAHYLDTDSMINALRKFISIRGSPMEIKSDRGNKFRECKQGTEQRHRRMEPE